MKKLAALLKAKSPSLGGCFLVKILKHTPLFLKVLFFSKLGGASAARGPYKARKILWFGLAKALGAS